MKILVGGAIAAVLGILGIFVWFNDFLGLVKGAFPAMLMLGGALAIYIGFDELKDSWKSDPVEEITPVVKEEEDPAKYKQEIDELKKEIETLKQTEAPTSTDSPEKKKK